MDDPIENQPHQFPVFLQRYKKQLTILLSTILLYAGLGFFLAPWLVQSTVTDMVKQKFNAELRIDKIEINPFILSIKIVDYKLYAPKGALVFKADELYINFQLSSLIRWAWTFDEFRLSGSELFLQRETSGQLNIDYFLNGNQNTNEKTNEKSGETETLDNGMARLLFLNLNIENFLVHWHDFLPKEPVQTIIGPVNIQIEDFNTLPQRDAKQSVHITTNDGGIISWEGNLQLNPIKSSASASIRGSHFPLLSAYIRQQLGFDIVEGLADIKLDYKLETLADGSLSALIDNIDLQLSGVVVNNYQKTEASTNNSEFIKLPKINLNNGSLKWPEQLVTLNELTIENSKLTLNRDIKGNIYLGNVENEQLPDVSTIESEQRPWQFSLDKFSIIDLGVSFEDQSINPSAQFTVHSLNLELKNISNLEGQKYPLALSFQVGSGGEFKSIGETSFFPSLYLKQDIQINNLALLGMQPYLDKFSHLKLSSGVLNVLGQINIFTNEPLSFIGDVDLLKFKLTEKEQNSILGSWERLAVNKINFSLLNNALSVNEILLDTAYSDVVIDENGNISLGLRVKNNTEVTEDKSDEEQSNFNIAIGKVILTDSSMNFSDNSLPSPFEIKIKDFNGTMSTISSQSSIPSELSFEGKVDEFGFVRLTGHSTLLNATENTDITAIFQNILMPKFTAYSIPFVGQKIAKGSLELELNYKLNDNVLDGANRIVLKEFELGETIPHSDAISLPLDLAVALLKDIDGKIDIDLPVEGDLADPEFSYGGVVRGAIANLMIKIVASPFTLLANLIGVESNELESISFIDGRSDLTPPELEKITKLTEALSLRPQLILELTGVVDQKADALALRTLQLKELVEQRVSLELTNDEQLLYIKQQLRVLEALFVEQNLETINENTLRDLRSVHTTSIDATDELAYIKVLEKQLIDNQVISQAVLQELAQSRISNIKTAILKNNELVANQISVGGIINVTKKKGELIKMKVALLSKPTKR